MHRRPSAAGNEQFEFRSAAIALDYGGNKKGLFAEKFRKRLANGEETKNPGRKKEERFEMATGDGELNVTNVACPLCLRTMKEVAFAPKGKRAE